MTDASADAIAEEIREIIIDAGQGRAVGETYQQMIWRAARSLGIGFNRAWAYFYRKIKRPPADEYLNIKARWQQLALDRAATVTRAKLQRTKERLDASGRQVSAMDTPGPGPWFDLGG